MTYLDVSIEGKTGSALDETANLCTGKVLGDTGQLGEIDIRGHDSVVPHLGGVDCQDLESASLVREGDLNVNFETTRTEQGLIDHVHPVRHTDDEDIVELVHTVHL